MTVSYQRQQTLYEIGYKGYSILKIRDWVWKDARGRRQESYHPIDFYYVTELDQDFDRLRDARRAIDRRPQ